jgi:hypothetical protein
MYIFEIEFDSSLMPYGNRIENQHTVIASNFESALEAIKHKNMINFDLVKYVLKAKSTWFEGIVGE